MKLDTFLAAYPFFSAETIAEVSSRGLFSLPHPNKWRLGDDRNGTTRSIRGRKFVQCDLGGPDWNKLIGLSDVTMHDRRYVILIIEGSKDALAAFEFAHRAGLLAKVGVVTALGTGYRPILKELAQLVGRRVVLIGDRDHAGIESVRRVSAALCLHDVDHVVLNWNAFPKFDGKDLFDLLQSSNGEKPSWYSEFFSFFSPFLSTHLSSQSSQSSQSSLSSLSSLFSSFICTGPGQRNRKLFDLAHATRQSEN